MIQATEAVPEELVELPAQSVVKQTDAHARGTTQLEAERIVFEGHSVESQATSTFPTQFQLGYLRDGSLRVVEPLSVTWTIENGTVIVEAPEIDEYGEGATIDEAIRDLQSSIAELFFDLEEERERLGSDLQRVYEILTRKLHKVNANYSE